MAKVTTCRGWPPKIRCLTLSIVSPSVFHEVMGLDAMVLVYWMLSFKSSFLLSSFFTFWYKGCVICVSEVFEISPGNFDSSLCLNQPGISHEILWYKLNKEGDSIQPWCNSFSNMERVCCSMSSEHRPFRNQWTKMDCNGQIYLRWPLNLLLWTWIP